MIFTPGLSTKFLKRECYSGSHKGMRYTIKYDGEKLLAYVYPEPWCLEQAPEESRRIKEFPFSSDGVIEATDWLNSVYENEKTFWNKADKEKMIVFLKK